jgi:putative redox protein
MSDEMRVRHLGGDRFAIDVRGHTLTVDQPLDAGGQDTAVTPTELFVAGLASCVAFYARRFLARHAVDPAGLEVATEYTLGGRTARVSDITIRITPPPTLPDERRESFLAVASHCTVHNTLADPPAVGITLDSQNQR